MGVITCLRHQHARLLALKPKTVFIGGEVGEAFWDVPWRHSRYPHADAEMLRLQTGHPAEFVLRRYDPTHLLNLAQSPGAFERPGPTWMLYRAFFDWVAVKPLFRTSHPSVEAGGLTGRERGYAVLANHTPLARTVTVETTLSIQSAARCLPSGSAPVNVHDQSFEVEVEARGGAIVEYRL